MSKFPTGLFHGRRFAVMGLGRNGLPSARALLAMGADVVAWDDKVEARVDAADVTLRDLRGGDFAFDALVLSPGIPHAAPKAHPVAERARAWGVPIVSDAELLYRAVRKVGSRARFVGITGTNGKSTTTALTAHILKTAGRPAVAGGNLGTAALALKLLPDNGFYVLEMSSYMLERLATLRFDAAAMLNLSPDHLDRHGDITSYIAAKRAIFDRQVTGDLAVVGVDDADSHALADWARTRPARVVTVSGDHGADVWCDQGKLRDAEGVILPMAEAPSLPGSHNAQNAAAASAIASALGVSHEDIARGLRSFSALPHRQKHVASIGGIAFVNDSKATNADAAARALGCYDKLVWIAGGLSKAGGIESLVPFFPRIARAVLIGRDAPILAATLAAHGVKHDTVGTLDAAVPAAFAAARASGASVVLLSPACASFDQFTGFEARGDRFAELATRIVQGRAA